MRAKVLFLPKWYPSRVDPNEGNYIERHAIAISGCADIAVLYVHSDQQTAASYEVCQTQEHGFPVVRVYFPRVTGPALWVQLLTTVRYLIAQWRGYRALRRIFPQPDITHVQILSRTAPFALYLRWTCGIPYIISEQWSGFLRERREFTGVIHTRITRWLASFATVITCNSEALKCGMRDYGFTGRIEAIPNIVDIDLFRPASQTSSSRPKRFIHLSRLDSHPKNLPGLLRAISMLSRQRSDFALHIMGTGVEEPAQQALARQLGIDHLITFHGYRDHEYVSRYMADAVCLVMFSNYESQCCAILEAFSAGIPVITTHTGGMVELMDPTRGITVPARDEAALARALSTMLDTFQKYDPIAIRQYATQHFASKVVGQRFAKLYSEVLEN